MLHSIDLPIAGDDPILEDVKTHLSTAAPGQSFIVISEHGCTVHFRRSEDHRLFASTWSTLTAPAGPAAEGAG